MRLATVLCVFLAVCGISFKPSLSAAELGVADAPELEAAEWIKGEKVTIAEGKGKNVYVVEFWATWCPPCRTSIPHLTDIQKKYKDKGVIMIGVTAEDAATVKPFVEQMGEKMDYRVITDKEQKTSAGYMEAFGVNGIPHAFIVDKKGKIVWRGHPMNKMEEVLDQVLAGNFDPGKAAKKAIAQEKLKALGQSYLGLYGQGVDEKYLSSLVEGLETYGKDDPKFLAGFAGLLATEGLVKKTDPKLALRLVKIAAANDNSSEVQIALAQVQMENNLKDAALATLNKAITTERANPSPDTDVISDLQTKIDEIKMGSAAGDENLVKRLLGVGG